MTAPATDDHLLPIARRHLDDAIHALAGRQRLDVDRDPADILDDLHAAHAEAMARLVDPAARAELQRRHEEAVVAATATTTWTPSRLEQLEAALETPTATGRLPHAGSQPPVWVDALDLRRTITVHVTEWATAWQTPGAGTIDRLHALADHRWRPQDVAAMATITNRCAHWCAEIDSLFDPPRKLSLVAACPSCQTATVYRPDAAGEYVRQAALTFTARGCECLSCRYVWPPTHYQLLADALGFKRPEGVLE